jgi:Xaa-Pro aminopeptidase
MRSSVILRPVEELNETLRSLKRTAYECDDVTVARLLNWQRKFKNTKFVQTSGIVEEFRRTKQKEELECILRACSITKAVLARVPRLLKPGVTERDIAWELERRCRKLGAEGMAFESIVAFSHNTASPHHRPSSRILKRGDIVQIDMGAKFNGYCSDYSRVFYTAEPTPEQRKVERAVMAAFRAAKAKVRPGVDVQSLDATAREALKKFGFDKEFCHALGHGVGLDIHEGVSLSSRAKKGTRLKKGEVITIEPGVYIAGKFGMRIEDTVVVK